MQTRKSGTLSANQTMMDQVAMFNDNGVQVYENRLVVYGQSIAVSPTDTIVLQHGRRTKFAAVALLVVALIVVGLSVFFASGPSLVLGLMVFIASLIAWRFQNVRHALLLVSNGQTRTVVDSTDLAWLERIEAALAGRQAEQPRDSEGVSLASL